MQRSSVLLVLALAACSPAGVASPQVLVRGARVLDGTGAPEQRVDVRWVGDRITEVGALQPAAGETVIDAQGAVLAPGFIDTHSHHDRSLPEEPGALGAVSQGITTIVVGQDGGSSFPLSEWFREREARPSAINVASYSGHNTLRALVLGDDFQREATSEEVDSMIRLLEADLAAGGLGLSSGLEYDPGIYASPDEVLALARRTAREGGRYISHLRSEDRALWDAVEEILTIGRETGMPVQISHMKLAMRALWGRAPELLARLDQARAQGIDVTADVYPYTFWQSTMTVLLTERDFDDRDAFAYALSEMVAPEGMVLARFAPAPELEGRTLAEIATGKGLDPVDAYMWLVAERERTRTSGGDAAESILATSMDEADVAALLRWPHSNVSSDGALAGAHPRGFGAFPRVLAAVREDDLFPLAEAVHRMTGLAAEHMGFEDRGTLRPGAVADLVLFDPDVVVDRATTDAPHQPAAGILRVWVAGQPVYEDGGVTGARPGRVLRRSGT
ncbi:MAG: D-aminoacylase [Gemmatimonadota bacterium]